jgi:hypothetical protein
MMMKMRFAITIHTHILNTICSQYKGISKSVLKFRTFIFLVKEITIILLKLGFIKFSGHHLSTQSVSECRRKQSVGEPRRPEFAYGQHVGFVVDKAALGQVFSEHFGFPFQSFHRFLHYHNHPGLTQWPLSGRSVEWTLIPPPTMQIKKNQ